MTTEWFSLRMRAVRRNRHLSGAERLGRAHDVPSLTAALLQRAMTHGGGPPDQVHCTVERLDPAEICHAELPAVTAWEVADWPTGRLLAGRLLEQAGVSAAAVSRSLARLAAGPAPAGGPMRGAMIVDSQNGRRLEADPQRGVRVSRMDVAPEERPAIERCLNKAGLGHHRVLEAMVLAGKVLDAPAVVAELCWSDEPDYLTGYVAAPECGYQRITPLKAAGDPNGGRVFFVDGRTWCRKEFVAFLEQRPLLLHGTPEIHPPKTWKA